MCPIESEEKRDLFDKMFLISKKSELFFLQKYFLDPSLILGEIDVKPEKKFEYLNFALKNAIVEKKYIKKSTSDFRNIVKTD